MRILIADDHGIVREGLRTLINGEAGMEVAGEAKDGREAVELAKQLGPDMIIMDVSMPNLNGIEATIRILKDNPAIKVIALSIHSDRHIVADMLRAGAAGYVAKSYLFEEVIRAIKALENGGHYLSPKITDVMVQHYVNRESATDKSCTGNLSVCERQIIQLVAEGLTTKQIGLHLSISPKTVDARRRQAMCKLDIDNIPVLTKYAIREGLTSAEF